MTPWSPATLDIYDGWPARSWSCGRNRWLDGVVEKIQSIEYVATVKSLADPKEKSRAVSELAREVGLTEEKVASVIEKLGLKDLKRVPGDFGDKLYRSPGWLHII
jgi:hypothetical protein